MAAILAECGMAVQGRDPLNLPRGHVRVDVLAEDTVEGITHRIICECKNWKRNVPQEKVHAFRTVMIETGANRGYIISSRGFQAGAFEAAVATNIELVTYEQFQELYFTKWFNRRIRAVEDAIGNVNVYYEPGPWAPPGRNLLTSDAQRAEYDAVWAKHYFVGALLTPFSPYLRMMGSYPPPALPMDVSMIEEAGFVVPDDIKQATGYREILALLEEYARVALTELRAVNPRQNGSLGVEQTEELDAPMPRPNPE
ncbi:hypothetical protein A5653_10840 [Mycobacterium colombiense]|nr:hypothetical protein A5653_10840 [Mycobacterium colombiense]